MPRYESYPPATLPLTGAETVLLLQGGRTVRSPASSLFAGGFGFTPARVFNVKDYGAIGNGVADDTVAIQAALTAAAAFSNGTSAGITVYIPPGKYLISSTVTIPEPHGDFGTGICLRGDGLATTILQWTGTNVLVNGGVMLKSLGQTSYRSGGFQIYNGNSLANKGTSVGLWMTGAVNGSTNGGQCVWEDVSFFNWHMGCVSGDQLNGHNISEVLFIRPGFAQCHFGFYATGQNSINYTMIMPLMGNNDVGVYIQTAQCFQSFGGSSTSDLVADFVFAEGGPYTVTGFRGEGSYAVSVAKATNQIVLNGCIWVAPPNVDDCLMDFGAGQSVTIIGCALDGKITMAAGPGGQPTIGSLTILGSILATDNQPVFPFGAAYPYGFYPFPGNDYEGNPSGAQHATLAELQLFATGIGYYPPGQPGLWGQVPHGHLPIMLGVYNESNLLVGPMVVHANGALVLNETALNSTATELTSGSNVKDRLGCYMKADKLVFAYNNAGTVTYLSIPLDGSTTTWTHSTSAP